MTKGKIYTQKGETDFINKVVEAVLKKDLSKAHYLIDDYGLMRFVSYEAEKGNPIVDLKYENGETAKVICVFSPELIEMHYKAGSDDLAKPWIKRAVKSVIAHGKQIAEVVYKNIDHY